MYLFMPATNSEPQSRVGTKGTGLAVATSKLQGMPEAYYDLYMDPREENPQLVPLIHTQGQFNRMVARHELFKKKYPDVENGKGIPYTGLSNARPETKAIASRIRAVVDSMPFSLEGVSRI